jgi:hypothetical protein
MAARRVRPLVFASILASVLVASTAGSAGSITDPGHPETIARRGPCTGASAWRLRVVALPTAELRVRFTIVGGAAGETWNLFMDSDGIGFFAGSRVSDVGGFVSVRRRTADGPTVELIRATAHDVATGEICRGRVRARVDA